MSLGPTIIFDKSALQGLNLDEAVWLDNFYISNITPLFLVETLADLDKRTRPGHSSQDVVARIAEKTPLQGKPNVHHSTICEAEMLGYPLSMCGVVVLPQGRRVLSLGRHGVVYQEAHEIAALKRWLNREFSEAERYFAKGWRRALSNVDLHAVYEEYRHRRNFHFPDLESVRRTSEQLLRRDGSRYATLRAAMDTAGCATGTRRAILARWKALGGPRLHDFAPYTAHLATVDMFFSLAIASDLISREWPSNKIDLAYLYYLPFCNVFVSSDSLHKRTVPHFLAPYQEFVAGEDLKADLAKLDAHYSTLPAHIRERGVMSFAQSPPEGCEFLTTRLWDRYLPRWRDSLQPLPRTAEEDQRTVDYLDSIRNAPSVTVDADGGCDLDEANFVMFEVRVPSHRGKWRIVPPEALK